MEITEDVIKLITQKLLGRAETSGVDSEALHVWLLKSGDHSKKKSIIVEYFMDWQANQSLQWSAYQAFMFGPLITLDKKPIVR